MASAEVPEHPGTGSAILGFVQWVIAGIAAPIAGLGGETTAVPMGLFMISGAALSMIGLLVLTRPGDRPGERYGRLGRWPPATPRRR
jgi:DHA1 family bicyclomycin/chloramphenicol resistance-like MFS transporter